PTETHSGTPSCSSRGRFLVRKRSMPGFARPIEFNIPTSVSAMRTGALPSRGSGVTVLVTNASSARATSGTMRASRQPEPLSSTEHRPFDAETLHDALDLDGAAVARAVAAGHRRLPGELRRRSDRTDRLEHRLRAAREHVEPRRDQLRHERRLYAALPSRNHS